VPKERRFRTGRAVTLQWTGNASLKGGRVVGAQCRGAGPRGIRKVVLKPQAADPIAIWDGEPKRASITHDSVYDEP